VVVRLFYQTDAVVSMRCAAVLACYLRATHRTTRDVVDVDVNM
jgi:hypothetical protein